MFPSISACLSVSSMMFGASKSYAFSEFLWNDFLFISVLLCVPLGFSFLCSSKLFVIHPFTQYLSSRCLLMSLCFLSHSNYYCNFSLSLTLFLSVSLGRGWRSAIFLKLIPHHIFLKMTWLAKSQDRGADLDHINETFTEFFLN